MRDNCAVETPIRNDSGLLPVQRKWWQLSRWIKWIRDCRTLVVLFKRVAITHHDSPFLFIHLLSCPNEFNLGTLHSGLCPIFPKTCIRLNYLLASLTTRKHLHSNPIQVWLPSAILVARPPMTWIICSIEDLWLQLHETFRKFIRRTVFWSILWNPIFWWWFVMKWIVTYLGSLKTLNSHLITLTTKTPTVW